MLQTGYAAIRKRKRDLLGYVKGTAQRWGERQLRSSLPCGHRAVKEGACAARLSGSQCRRGSRGLGFPTCKQVPWGLVWTRRHTKGSAPLLACSPIRPGRPGPSDPGGPPCWDPQAQESPDGGDGSSSPVFPSGHRVRKHKPTAAGDRRQRGAIPLSSEQPCPRHAWPADPRAHNGPRQPLGASTAAQPLLDGTPFPNAPGPGWASPQASRKAATRREPWEPQRPAEGPGPGSGKHSRALGASGQEAQTCAALCGATAGHTLPFTGGDGDRQGLGRWRSSPPHPHEGPSAPAPPFLPSLGHPRIQPLSICREAWSRGPLSEKEG